MGGNACKVMGFQAIPHGHDVTLISPNPNFQTTGRVIYRG